MKLSTLVSLLVVVAVSSASPAYNATGGLGDSCTIYHADQAAAVTANCYDIVVGTFTVPAGQTLKLALKPGAKLKFSACINFEYAEWDGPLIWITGDGISVWGDSNHLIDGRGHMWWDGKGDHSDRKKPQMMLIQATGGSWFTDLRIKNCPHTCIGISDSHDVTLKNWNLDNKDGDSMGGANTDGFDIAKSYKITIQDTVVWNQDDCVCINQGQHLLIDNIQCTGGHGLSIAVGIWDTYELNTVYNVTFQNSVVQNSRNGIHVKSLAGSQTGEITDVTYKNIKLSDISYYGINVQQDYTNDGDTHQPLGNIKIKNLNIQNVWGNLGGYYCQKVYILCGEGGCSNWWWSDINIDGAKQSNACNFQPNNFWC